MNDLAAAFNDNDDTTGTGEALPLAAFRALPKVIVIDVTNSCNLRCPVCPVTTAMTRRRGMMTVELFQRVVNGFMDLPEKPEIHFTFSGEPTLHPLLPRMVERAAAAGHPTLLSTNCTKLSERLSEDLIRSGLSAVHLCLDGFDQVAQESYRVRSDFHRVKKNIENFMWVRAHLGADTLHATLETLLTSYSEHQMDDIIAWARDYGIDRVRFKTLATGTHSNEEALKMAEHFRPSDPKLRHTVAETRAAACAEPLETAVVFWDGAIGICGVDYNQAVELPKITEGGFLAAFTSDAAVAARREGYLKQQDICRECPHSDAENSGFEVDLIPE